MPPRGNSASNAAAIATATFTEGPSPGTVLRATRRRVSRAQISITAQRHGSHSRIVTSRYPALPATKPRTRRHRRQSQTVDFRGLNGDCASCHEDVHRGQLGTTCATCHGTRAFRVTTFQHSSSPEFFKGKHATTDCSKCHRDAVDAASVGSTVSSRRYRGLSTACATCHTDVHLGQLGSECASCHTVDEERFSASAFDHSQSAFSLTGKHAAIECVKCHKRETGVFPAAEGSAVRFKGVDGTCQSCHQDIHLGQLGDRCHSCHGSETFRLPNYTHQAAGEFFEGMHATLACAQCHPAIDAEFPAGFGRAARFSGIDQQCTNCHDDVHRGTLGSDCASCHGVFASFRNASRAFHKDSLLPLEGRHVAVPCADCHWNGQIEGTPTRCFDCHWIRRQDDRFRTELGPDCEQCHRPISWTAVSWEHGAATGHDLGAAHFGIDCEACHAGAVFDRSLPTDCVSCHLDDYNATTIPTTRTAGFPTDCEVCHSASDPTWERRHLRPLDLPAGRLAHQPRVRRLSLERRLPGAPVRVRRLPPRRLQRDLGSQPPDRGLPHRLRGLPQRLRPLLGGRHLRPLDLPAGRLAHQPRLRRLPLERRLPGPAVRLRRLPPRRLQRHLGPQPRGPPASPPTARSATAPPTPTWEGATFAHTIYPLVGSHTSLECNACHSSGVYQGLPSDCVDCHLDDYNATYGSRPPDRRLPHRLRGLPQRLRPVLGGRHLRPLDLPAGRRRTPRLDCNACHSSGVYQGLPSECVDCHLDDYNATDDPEPPAAGFPTDCEVCHSASDPAWDRRHLRPLDLPAGRLAHQPRVQRLSLERRLPGAAVRVRRLPPRRLQRRPRIPTTATAGFPTDCEVCHSASDPSWDGATFDHSIYPLVGVARQPRLQRLSLERRLPGPAVRLRRLPPRRLQRDRDPEPPAAGFPTDCELCHGASDPSWDRRHLRPLDLPAGRLAHQPRVQRLPLERRLPGAAVRVRRLPPRRLQRDLRIPNHRTAGFPTDCEVCHRSTDLSWNQGIFNHVWFPIDSGAHRRFECAECHPSAGSYAVFTCTTSCHPASEMNEKHHEVNGYSYNSANCLSCHPDGRS